MLKIQNLSCQPYLLYADWLSPPLDFLARFYSFNLITRTGHRHVSVISCSYHSILLTLGNLMGSVYRKSISKVRIILKWLIAVFRAGNYTPMKLSAPIGRAVKQYDPGDSTLLCSCDNIHGPKPSTRA